MYVFFALETLPNVQVPEKRACGYYYYFEYSKEYRNRENANMDLEF
ncbi:MAG: hypothetical protein BAJATHORv1_70085 [Candidatus Thorarchaeota archaeon]|nr:MAG: hypothetical protein BAJATHORv1_70085 [Candidatus Thorarchaeota archaeon]